HSTVIPEKQIPTKAFVINSPGSSFVLQDVVLDEVRPHEVLIEMKYTGLCHTDLVVQQGAIPIGEYPAVLGHEGAGIVRRVGSAAKVKTLGEGDHVFLSFTTCNNCIQCSEERNGFCRQFMPINFGGVRESSIVQISSSSGVTNADLAVLVPLGCGYLTGAGTFLNVLEPRPSSRFIVLGMGAVGLSALMAARSHGVENVVAVDIVDSKLELPSSLGASHTLNTKGVPDLA
ncbi:hypothetical protein N7490_002574, partial [Penicillium lividum]